MTAHDPDKEAKCPENVQLLDVILNTALCRYGFNSQGHDVVKQRIKKWEKQKSSLSGKHLGVNLGKNKNSEKTAVDYVKGVRELGPYADYLVINVSSPNTPGLRSMQKRELLTQLLDDVVFERNKLPNRPPLLVKIAPDLTDKDKCDIAAVVTAKKGNIDGLIISNTTISRSSDLKSTYQSETGGLSGLPLRELSTQTISDMYILTAGTLPIIGVGGISSGQDAYDKIISGASLVQLYTGLVYQGPPLVKKIKTDLADILQNNGYKSVGDAVGAKHKNTFKQLKSEI